MSFFDDIKALDEILKEANKVSCVVHRLEKQKLIQPPQWLSQNICYEVMMGSVAYGVSTDYSDTDIYGFCIPPKATIFPHLNGEILGFGRQNKRFEQYLQHRVVEQSSNKEYDLTIYNIVKYFHLCMENNPNMIDSLFVPQDCVLYINQIGNMLRDNRKAFLHKGSWAKFKGYSFSQLHKMSSKNPTGKRVELRKEYGFDVKFAYHTVRLLYEAEMILSEGDIDLRRHREHLKSIRRGEISEQEIREWASNKEKFLENLYQISKIPYGPDEDKIKQLLLDCLEHHYGNLEKAINIPSTAEKTLSDIVSIINNYRKV